MLITKNCYISIKSEKSVYRDGSRAAATSKTERFVIIVNGFQPLTIITKCSILDVATALDPPLVYNSKKSSLCMTFAHFGSLLLVE